MFFQMVTLFTCICCMLVIRKSPKAHLLPPSVYGGGLGWGFLIGILGVRHSLTNFAADLAGLSAEMSPIFAKCQPDIADCDDNSDIKSTDDDDDITD